MPLLFASNFSEWNFATGPSLGQPGNISTASAEPSKAEAELPPDLLRPLGVLFTEAEAPARENFLAGLHAQELLGARELPAEGPRRAPLAWVGVALRKGSRRLFAELRGGCWVRGFPVVGRARTLLRTAGLADPVGLRAALRELGFAGALGATLYFNFPPHRVLEACERVYVLDADEGRLHGFALAKPVSGEPFRACAGSL